MIQVYSESNTTYTQNGNAILEPTEAYTEAELNGTWSASLTCPIDPDGKWKYLTRECVIKMPSFNGEQLYRVVSRDKTDDYISVKCYPIFYDCMNEVFLTDTRPTSKSGQACLNILCTGKYSGSSNISKVTTAYYQYVNLLEALTGDEENSFINRWGGEVLYNNYNITINTSIGSDAGLTLRAGCDIIGVDEQIDMQDVVTRIYPVAFNGRKPTGSYVYIDSTYKDNYPTIKATGMEFSNIMLKSDASDDDLSDPDVTICNDQTALNTALAAACQNQFDAGVDRPTVNITINELVDLAKTREYEGFNRNFSLGDTVYVKHEALDMTTSARVIYLKYDSIRQCTESIQLGQPSYDYFKNVSKSVSSFEEVITSSGSVRAEAVKGKLDLSKTNLYAQYDAATESSVQAILFENNDSTSTLYGAMAIGTQGFMISKQKDSDGNWVWSTWGTANGLVADYIKAGTLSSTDGSSYWDLENSKLAFYDEANDTTIYLDKGYIIFKKAGVEFGRICRYTQSSGSTSVLTVSAPNLRLQADSDNSIGISTTNGIYINSDVGLHIDNYATFTGSKTISGTTLKFRKGLLISS